MVCVSMKLKNEKKREENEYIWLLNFDRLTVSSKRQLNSETEKLKKFRFDTNRNRVCVVLFVEVCEFPSTYINGFPT